MLRKNEFLLLVLAIILGLFLRLFFLKDGAITFGFDQARDAYNAAQIAGGHIKIQGPSASTPGLFHGVFYYYLITPSYWLGHGNPVITNIWLSVVNIATVIPIFLLGNLLFSPVVGLLAALLFSVSLDATQYANWMSNPAPAVLTVAIFYLGLAYFVFSKHRLSGIVLTAVGLGLSIQSEVFLGYLFVPLILVLNTFRAKPTLNQALTFSVIFILTVSSMIASYIKFGPTFLSGFANLYAVGGDPFGAWREFFPTLGLYINRFAEYFYRGLLPFNVMVGGAVGFFIVGWAIRQITRHKSNSSALLFLLILIFSHGLLIPFGGNSTPFINAGLQAAVFSLVAVFIVSNFPKHKIWIGLLTFLIVFSSLNAIFKYDREGQTVFAIQRGLILRNEQAAIDYTYTSSNGQSFSVNTVTSPLWINTVWAYLYNWYGKDKFGYVPSFHGRDQTGNLGSMPAVTSSDKIYYLIIEPLAGIPTQFATDTVSNEDSFSKVIQERDFGGITVQKRLPTKPFKSIHFI